MSDNVKMCGYSIKANSNDQNLKRMFEISKLLGIDVDKNLNNVVAEDLKEVFFDMVYGNDRLNEWKPYCDVDGIYGFIYQTEYEYEAYDIEYYVKITDLGKALHEFIDKTKIIPENDIKGFGIIYYNGGDNPFKL